ncbi:class I SAM-dependent methyltransferase [Luteibacter sp. ME-Dv--P-043b]|uniref:class I SAM-dependent methyltransferase n=1 Tax=Luteibacter sp. ME-Dv--P-043b TaxID=3040291 RepID=UPI0025579682|nr:class I SAM-dependent methyltransferase [Luteibacter sp. ME-Dv--P-043b]
MKCRHCAQPLTDRFIDLGSAPPSNAYLSKAGLSAPEKWYPLTVLACTHCWLVQTEDFTNVSELFDSEYAYFSGFSTSWLAHCERYAATMVERFGLDCVSLVVEIAANDGSLLGCFHDRGIASLGVEPTASTAASARARGLDIVEAFFCVDLARELVTKGHRAALMAANNVLAHVPDINDFVSGFAILLADDGVATFEFPHLLNLVRERQFDTIYHEHYSYLSLLAVARIFAANGLTVFDVDTLPTHGGSLRVYAQRATTGARPVGPRVGVILEAERHAGMNCVDFYRRFQVQAETVKDDFLAFLIEARRAGKRVAAYGAAAKGNTLLNFAGVRSDLIGFVVDRNPSKQGKYMPGSRIPIRDEAALLAEQPDYIVLLPWNLRAELVQQLDYVREWGGRFVTAIPSLAVFDP